ncbi:hypothetical protein ACFYST_10590 [Kitasatospora sp. NPDC004614]|uniref:hypothetical protein n=1 Tax=unclassified Kitasatospora TaxID=2633591 RepID=UPI00369B690D
MAADKEKNEGLTSLIAEAGCTYAALAREVRLVAAEAGETVRTGPPAVHFWVSGGIPNPATVGYLTEALSRKTKRKVTPAEIGLRSEGIGEALSPDPLATAVDLGRLVMNRRRDFLALAFSAAAVGLPLTYDHTAAASSLRTAKADGRISAETVATVRFLTESFRSADERLGGGHGLAMVASYLVDDVMPMLKANYTSATVRASAFGAAAELATLVGWKHHDLGREGAAQQFYLLGFQLASEADSQGHAAWMMRALTHQALDLGQTKHCVDLAEAALAMARGKVDRGTEALLLVTAARAYGAGGRPRDAARAILGAEDAMAANGDQLPAYAAASGPVASTVASHMGKTLTEMKDHQAAERHYRTALDGRLAESYRRVRGLTVSNLAKTVAAQGRHEEAVGLWGEGLDLMDGVASKRAVAELKSVRSTMAVYSRRGIPGAADLGHRAASLIRP